MRLHPRKVRSPSGAVRPRDSLIFGECGIQIVFSDRHAGRMQTGDNAVGARPILGERCRIFCASSCLPASASLIALDKRIATVGRLTGTLVLLEVIAREQPPQR